MSWKETVEPVFQALPSVEGPDGHVSLRKKLTWTLGILVLYFFLTNVGIFGLSEGGADAFGQFRGILAGEHGSVLQLGIGPIVFGSIALQLIVGAGIFNIDRQDPRDQAIYQGLQKVFVFGIVLIQAFPLIFVFDFLPADPILGQQLGLSPTALGVLMYLQIVIGGILIFYMDAVVSKWGIGSGVGLFIVAGVSQRLIGGLIGIPGYLGSQWGVIPSWVAIITGRFQITWDLQSFLFGQAQLLAVLTTVLILGIVVYAELVKVEIPVKRKGTTVSGTYPIKLIYASVIPIIIIRAIQANFQILGRGLDRALGESMPAWLGQYANGQPTGGFFYFVTPIQSPEQWMWWTGTATGEAWQILLRVGVDMTITIVGAALLSVFWVQTTDMGADSVASKISRGDLEIPGFRDHPSIIEKRVEKYIPQVTILGGALVGFLAVLANLLGTIGGVTGVGLLLTVSITYKLYEQLAKEGMKEMHPMARQLFD